MTSAARASRRFRAARLASVASLLATALVHADEHAHSDGEPHDAASHDAASHDAASHGEASHDAAAHDVARSDGAAAHDHAAAHASPSVTDVDRAAAFPELDDMDMSAMMVEDPFNRAVLLDQLETRDGDVTSWDFEGWVGRSAHRVWIRTEGEREPGSTDRAELQLLYGRPIAPWWDVVAGVREDFEPGPSRTWAALGVEGVTPYRLELEATAFVGEGGRSALRVEAEYDLLITNRLILQPLVELQWYGASDAVRGIGAGLSHVESGLRLRYEIRREIAPYVGVVRERAVGRTADLARAANAETRETRWVAGVRMWF